MSTFHPKLAGAVTGISQFHFPFSIKREHFPLVAYELDFQAWTFMGEPDQLTASKVNAKKQWLGHHFFLF